VQKRDEKRRDNVCAVGAAIDLTRGQGSAIFNQAVVSSCVALILPCIHYFMYLGLSTCRIDLCQRGPERTDQLTDRLAMSQQHQR
jgi:hypothetical protein